MDVYAQIAEKIIESQEAIIGPVAIEQAEQIPNLKIDWPKRAVTISGDGVTVIELLVQQYKQLFGQISVEVSKEAAAAVVNKDSVNQLPQILR
jgi:hypothetical protein